MRRHNDVALSDMGRKQSAADFNHLRAARSLVSRQLLKYGGSPQLRLNFTTDSGHKIIDVHDMPINEPLKLEDELNRIPGIVENGLFARHPAHVLIIGRAEGAEVIKIGG